MSEKYTKEFLISELHRFYKENNRIPTFRDMGTKNGYPAAPTYQRYFGTWNNAIQSANFHTYGSLYSKEELIYELKQYFIENNKVPRMLDFVDTSKYTSYVHFIKVFGTWNNGLIEAGLTPNKHTLTVKEDQLCEVCGGTTLSGWNVKNNKIVCHRCYKRDRNYLHGILDPNCTSGVAVITEFITSEVLKDTILCNTAGNFTAPYDLVSNKYGNINVKSASGKLHTKYNNYSWRFRRGQNEKSPDYYFCIGFDEYRMNIIKVWIIPSNASIVCKSGIGIYADLSSLKRTQQYEVDPTPYNEIYQNLDIYTLPEFCNLPRGDPI